MWIRMLTCWIDDRTEQDNKVLAREFIIRTYGDSKPFPAYLVSHVCKNRTIHVNYAIHEIEDTIVIITAYEPDPELWDETYTYKVKK